MPKKVTAVHAEHSSEMILEDPMTGKETSHPAGEPVGYILQLDKFYGEKYRPDLLLTESG